MTNPRFFRHEDPRSGEVGIIRADCRRCPGFKIASLALHFRTDADDGVASQCQPERRLVGLHRPDDRLCGSDRVARLASVVGDVFLPAPSCS